MAQYILHFKFPPKNKNMTSLLRAIVFGIIILFLASLFGAMAGFAISTAVLKQNGIAELKNPAEFFGLLPGRVVEKEQVVEKEYIPQTSHEERIVSAVKEAGSSVVSVLVIKEVSGVREFDFGSIRIQLPGGQPGKQEVGSGTGFIVSEDGLILTNKHVVLDDEAEYVAVTSEGQRYPVKVLARDPFQDLAVLKISGQSKFIPLQLGNSDTLEVGQTVIAIGNALGEFRNTVSVGVVSGLGRNITASGGGLTETIENLIQTDAAINPGNSGGPLLNLAGQVIGVNVAKAQAENIGFAIPINQAKRDIEQVKRRGKIVYPFLGVCWRQVTPELKEALGLSVDYGALINKGDNCPLAVFPGSAAQKAGLKEDDIILEWEGQKLTPENSLTKMIQKHEPGDVVTLKVMRGASAFTLQVTLGERSE